MSQPPSLDAAQRKRAIESARQARSERARAKSELREGRRSFFSLVVDPSESIRKMRVAEALEAVPGVGAIRANAMLERNAISPSRRIGGLGVHQIHRLRKEPLLNKIDTTPGLLIVMSGPGGVGKSTIAAALRNDPRFWVSVSATTRPPRPYERDGHDYLFLSDHEFQAMVDRDEFLEWADFAGARYGTPKTPVEQWRATGKHVILEIEIEGARQVRKVDPRALMVFIAPPSWEALVERLTGRGTDSPERRQARLELAEQEMAASGEFDATLINTQVEEVIAQLIDLVASR